jgi:hypothetical protein
MNPASYSAKVEEQVKELHRRLNLIVESVKNDGITAEFEDEYLPEKYDEFCQRYVCPEYFAPPKAILPKSEYEKLNDEYVDLFRGVNALDMLQLNSHFQNFQTGPFFIGAEKCGAYATGDITLPRECFARTYVGLDEGQAFTSTGCVMRFCYKEQDMNTICEDDLNEITKKYFEIHTEEIKSKTGVEKSIFNLLENYFIVESGDYKGTYCTCITRTTCTSSTNFRL